MIFNKKSSFLLCYLVLRAIQANANVLRTATAGQHRHEAVEQNRTYDRESSIGFGNGWLDLEASWWEWLEDKYTNDNTQDSVEAAHSSPWLSEDASTESLRSRRALEGRVPDVSVLNPTCQRTHRPNIIVYYTDDQGFGDRQKYNPSILTMPNFERVAQSGIDFTNGHSESGVCSPSRFSMLTGEYFFRHSKSRNALGARATPVAPKAKTTIPEMLRSVGYKTYMAGKWHLGMQMPKNLASGQIKGGPLDVGFDRFYGIPASMDYGSLGYIRDRTYVQAPTHYSKRTKGLVQSCPGRGCVTWGLKTCAKAVKGKCNKGEYYNTRASGWDLSIAPDFDPRYAMANFTDAAISFIDEHMTEHGRSVPFYVYLAQSGPHLPHYAHPAFDGNSSYGAYGDVLNELDHRLGQVLDTVEKWNVTQDTLIIVTSDNGPEGPGKFRRSGLESTHIFSGAKRSLREGGHRVPFIASWPAVIPGGRTFDKVVGQVDLLSTLMQITGALAASAVAMDSFSFWPALCDPDNAPHRTQPSLHEIPRSKSGSGPGVSFTCDEMKVFHDSKKWHMFDLLNDPGEQNDLFVTDSQYEQITSAAYDDDADFYDDQSALTITERYNLFHKYRKVLDEIIERGHSAETAICTQSKS